MIKNIIFDMGNVLLKFNPWKYVEDLGIEDEKDKILVFNETYNTWKCPYLDRGDFTEEAFVEEVNKNLPEKYHKMVEKLIFHWADQVTPMPGMADLIKEIKDKGYKVYLLSNAGYRQHEYWFNIPGHEYFDGTVVSCDIKAIKPERKIYEALFEKFNIDPKESFFIDDLAINIYGAREAGMEGFVFHGDTEELRQELKKRGVL